VIRVEFVRWLHGKAEEQSGPDEGSHQVEESNADEEDARQLDTAHRLFRGSRQRSETGGGRGGPRIIAERIKTHGGSPLPSPSPFLFYPGNRKE
jgi:hypothetical protein